MSQSRNDHLHSPDPTISCFPIDFDGTLEDTQHLSPLQSQSPTDKNMVLSQSESFKHYIYHLNKQNDGFSTELDIEIDDDTTFTLTLPPLRHIKTSNLGKETKNLSSDDKYMVRYHGKKVVSAPNAKVAADVTRVEPNISEIQRRITARDTVTEKHSNNTDEILDDGDDDQSEHESKIESDDEMNDQDSDIEEPATYETT